MSDKENQLNEDLINTFAEAVQKVNPVLVGDIILVSRLPKEEIKTASGLVITTGGVKQINAFDSHVPQFVQVVAVGQGFYEGDKSIPVDLEPGNIIEVAGHAVTWFSSFGIIPDSKEQGTGIGITREAEYRIKFKNYTEYCEFMKPFKQLQIKK